MKLPHPLRGLRRALPSRSLLRDPRVALLGVPLAAGVLLMTSTHGASPIPVSATSTTTTVKLEDLGDPALPTDSADGGAGVAAAPASDTDGHSAGSGADGGGYGSGGSGGGYSSGGDTTYDDPVGGGSPPVSVRSATTIRPGIVTPTNPTPTTSAPSAPTTTIPGGPGPVVQEAASPAVMGIVGVGVAAVVVNSLLLVRRRRSRGVKR